MKKSKRNKKQKKNCIDHLGAMRLVVAAAGDRVIVTEVMPNGMFAPVKFATVCFMLFCLLFLFDFFIRCFSFWIDDGVFVGASN